MNMPVSVLRREDIFEKVISIKYDVPNDQLDMYAHYKAKIDKFYTHIIETNA